MRSIVYVISDLHLGGAAAGSNRPDFQMCSLHTQALLGQFIEQLPGRTGNADSQLIIAGDIVDFLAEEPFEAFTSDPASAERKLNTILERTSPIWDALQEYVNKRHGALTLLLGNHDVELAMPTVRQVLLNRLGEGRVHLIYDNEAFTLGPLLIEHGNRYDEWNAVPHDALRRVRSQLSRRQPINPPFPAMPGSRMVEELVNPLKQQYAFVDLLKPEDAALLPVLIALGAGGIKEAWTFFRNFVKTRAVDYDENREPVVPGFIAAQTVSDESMFLLAQSIASDGAPGQISAGAPKLFDREARRAALYKCFRAQSDLHRKAFNMHTEKEIYLMPAHAAASAGFQVVVYGHTHHVKKVALGDSPNGLPVYLNTGTWADLICVPTAVWAVEENIARDALQAFIDDLEGNHLTSWRRSLPTYAKIEIDGELVISADVYFADDHAQVTADALAHRLAGEHVYVSA
ncbi:metallophosphoesterase [Telluria aromaticivorans]|uniref:Metallophosphatase n=1 Tax=Telluria aromaticivorans TaxID=2725995 RepID=A0A7Y2NZJ3_9BURK|nr:metallophosphoesterase [Telluria aromaticivorans]NNG23188.1 metallophosphatase [Telluria aromaticivorans]